MHMSMGKDRMKLMRDARPAILRAAAFSSSVAGTMPKIFFWFGQMNTQTLNNMIVPSQAPTPLVRKPDCNVNAFTTAPPLFAPYPVIRYRAPVTQVATAAQRNHRSARGAMYFD